MTTSKDDLTQPEKHSTDQLPATSGNETKSTLIGLPVCCGNDGNTYITIADEGNSYALQIGSKQANNFIRHLARQSGTRLKYSELREINDELASHAEHSSETCDVYYRIASVKNGIELDIGDANHTRIQVTPGKVEPITEGSCTLFHRTAGMRPLPTPAQHGDLKLLRKYVNLDDPSVVLFVAWICYTLAHAKVPTSNYVILVLQGDQGSGKSTLCRLVQALIDPCVVGNQSFPNNKKDLVVAAQHAHVLFFDNMRNIKPSMADTLSIASTGGSTTTRRLYTDGEMHVHRLHVAMVLNGIHSFVDQPDLAQRCLPLYLRPINEQKRRSESEFVAEFQADLPVIFRGLLDLIADILTLLPSIEVTNPERMIDFVRWLAAMEKVDGAPAGVYQMQYSEALTDSMHDSLMDNSLAAAVLSFMEDIGDVEWSGTPTELLQKLNFIVGSREQYARDWPRNAIALSKRLSALQAGLRRQGIEVTLSRGKERRITVVSTEAY